MRDKEFAGEARSRIAGIQYVGGKKDDAYKTIDDLLQEQKSDIGFVVKARMQLNDGKIDDAVASLKSAVDANPRSADAQYLLGTIAEQRGDLDEAATHFDEVLRLRPNAVPAQLRLTEIELRRGQAEWTGTRKIDDRFLV